MSEEIGSINALFTLPFPSCSISRGGAALEIRHRKTVALVCCWDDPDPDCVELIFEHVWAFKCTQWYACDPRLTHLSYDRVVDLGRSDWNIEIEQRIREAHDQAEVLRHLAIYFDDGPCFEFICGGFCTERHAACFQGRT